MSSPCRFATIQLLASLCLAGVLRAEEPLEVFLLKHCIACHGPDQQEGQLNFDQLSRDFKLGADTHLWAEALDKVNSGEMPPEEESRPAQGEIAAFVSSLDARIKEGRAARMAARPAIAHYRLSRKEYQNTVYDLLGVRYDPTKPGELNEDTLWHGFERIGSELSLSPSHVMRYYKAAGLVLDRALPAEPPETHKVRKTAADLRYGGGKGQQEVLDRFGIKRPLRFLLVPEMTYNGSIGTALSPDWLGKAGPAQSGLYRMRLQASGIRPEGGQVPHMRIGRKDPGSGAIDGLIEIDVVASEDNPKVYEFTVPLEMPTALYFNVVAPVQFPKVPNLAPFMNAIGYRPSYIFTHSSETQLLNPTAPQMFDDKGNGIFPTVLVDWIEWEGPIETPAEKALRKDLLPPENATEEVVAEHLQRFAERAWRRPVHHDELEHYLAAYRSERQAGEPTNLAFQVAMTGVLNSRHFLYLVEGDPVPREYLNDWELASRLSYFLWSSMPDERLREAANRGALSTSGLSQEVDRILSDQKIHRFIDDFTRQWLQLHRLGMFAPDKNLYPRYDDWLEESLRAEPVEYFREMFAKNLSVDDFIASNWTVANPRVCEFYGLPEPTTDGFHPVSLEPEDHRGGLLTMGAVLGLTSDGTRHRPVHRGVWLSEVVLGKTPPPPPANVPAIEPNPPESPKATLRQKLEAHRNNANCAACHARIDPLGIAWDNYDAIGQWRTRERVAAGVGEDPLINPAGLMPDGRPFKDATEFKQRLLEDRESVARAFIEHLCTYGLRRVLTFDDQEDLEAIAAEAREANFRIRDIVRAVALSDLMRKR